MMTHKAGIYLHIPFCLRRCGYCDFCSYTGRLSDMPAYVERLFSEMRRTPLPPDYTVDTVYLGGGTPSLLSGELLARLLDGVFSSFRVEPGAEISCEVNPGTVDGAALRLFRAAGVNRLSMGVQSLSDRELALLGRIHTADEAVRAFHAAREAGFDNISLDLMTGIPAETPESLAATVAGFAALGPEHISAYALKIEEGTPFAARRASLSLPDEDRQADAVTAAAEALEAAGYRRYEISNYARPGYESRHNLRYWRGEEYLGFGPSAYSYFGGWRYGYGRDLDAYLRDGFLPRQDETYIDARAEEEEFLMLRLRLCEGIPVREYEARFHRDFYTLFGRVLDRYADFFVQRPGAVALSPRGMLVSNSLIVEMLASLPEGEKGT